MLIFSDSFERQRNSVSDRYKWNLVGSTNLQYSTVGPRTQTHAAAEGFGQRWNRQVRSSEEHATFIVGFAVKASSTGDLGDYCYLSSDAGATIHLTVHVNTNGSITVYRGTTSGPVLGSTAASVIKLGVGVWQFVEVKATLSDTVGTVVIHVDEIEVLNVSGVDTKNAGTKTVFDSMSVLDNAEVDDLYLCNGAGTANNDFRGNRRVEQLQPSGNGTSSGMTNSAGNSTSNYSYVNDSLGAVAPQPSTYVDGTSGQKDTYVFGDSGQPVGNAVDGIIVWAYAQKTDNGAITLSAVCRLAGVESSVAMVSSTPSDTGLLNGIFDWFYAVFETKPGGGAWTVADVNAAEFGYSAA